MNRSIQMSLSAVLMLVMIASYFAVFATPVAAQDMSVESSPAVAPEGKLLGVDKGPTKLASVSADKKIDASLAAKMKGTMGTLKVYVLITDRTEVNRYLSSKGMPLVKGAQIDGLPTTRVMELFPSEIAELAGNPGIYKIMNYETPVFDDAPLDRAVEDVPVDIAKPTTEDFDVDVLHGATEAWADGYTGSGVKIAVIDTGMDMAHPDLLGQQARYEDPSSPYFGWPIAYDDRAAYYWSMGFINGWIADTTATSTDLGGYVSLDGRNYSIAGLTDAMGNPVVSQSGVYHIGYHTDLNLMMFWLDYIGVLVVDAVTPGVYDTVYVDVTDDSNFANDKACTKGDEASYYDFYNSTADTEDYSMWNAGDGYADMSGGMIYWISDGVNTLPGTEFIYSAFWAPGSGDAVAFVGEFSYGESHGTMTSSAALGTGASYGGQLSGMAPDAKLIAIPFTNDMVSSWLFAEFGTDGLPGTGDEANIVSNSYGYSETAIEAGYDIYDKYASNISLMGGHTLWFWSTGNGGPGYGTVHSPLDFLAVHCGATTTMQYRYWLGYESDINYTSWGDMAPFSNSGPTRTGKLNAEISASGMYSMEPAPLNEYSYGGMGDGYMHFQLGSGTSHSTPTVAGGAALGFQAYYDTYADWPWIDYAKAKLIASADDMHYDPLKQGSGWLNASTYAKTMGEYAGVSSILLYEPVLINGVLYPGSYDGAMAGPSYDNFPNFLLPDEIDESHFGTTYNYDPSNPVNVEITSEMLMRTGSDRIDWTTTDITDQWFDIKPMIPVGTDLVKITWFMPMDEFDPELDYVSNYGYMLETHDWVDLNLDGNINKTTGDWELFRMAVDGGDCNYNQISVRDPLDRTHDGLVVRVRPGTGGPGIGLAMSLQMDYYQLQNFDWVQFREVGAPSYSPSLSLTVNPMSSMDWQIEVHVPFDAYVGTYAAAIYIDDGSRVQAMPVVINVPATDYEFEFGANNYFETTYNNDITGEADKGWRFEVGDWRMYWCLPTTSLPSVDANLIVTVEWSSLPTDINIHVLAPVSAGGWPTQDAPYGPNLAEIPIASSNERYLGGGTFGVGTSTGGPAEVISAPLGQALDATGPAPFAILTRCPVMDGYAASDTLYGYTTLLTMNDFGPPLLNIGGSSSIPFAGSYPAWYDITVSGSVEAKGSGVGPLKSETFYNEPIYQDSMTGYFQLDLANAAYTRAVELTSSSLLSVFISEVSGAPDLDLGVWQDTNRDGLADLSEPYWYVGITGSSESLVLDSPADGQYLIKVLGYTVTGSPGLFDLTVMRGVPGYIRASMPENIVSSGYHVFNIDYSVPAETGTYTGLATFGFMGADDMYFVPVMIHVDLDTPMIEDIVPADGATLGSNALVVTFDAVEPSGSFVSGINWDNVQLRLDGMWDFYSSSPSVEITPPAVTFTCPLALSEGSHTVTIWIVDYWGNMNSTTVTFTVNSVIEGFTAEWAEIPTNLTLPDSTTIASTHVMLRGHTDPLASVDITVLTGTYSTVADSGGYFEITPIELVMGLNVASITSMNSGGVSVHLTKMITSDAYCTLWTSDIDTPTSDPNVEVVGMSEPGATVMINLVPIPVNPDGSFRYALTLGEGLNTIQVDATDKVGNENQVLMNVVLDTTPPSLAIIGPSDGSNVTEPSVMVHGTTDPGASVWVNGVLASNGTAEWAATVVLAEGTNTIVVTASDALGNGVTLSINVAYIPPVYVTPEELAAAQAELEGMITNLSASLSENVTALQAQIDAAVADIAALQAALAENMTDLQGQIDGLATQLTALQIALADNISALQSQIDAAVSDISELQTALAENITRLDGADAATRASLLENVTNLLGQIDDLSADLGVLQADLADNVTDLQGQLDALDSDLSSAQTALQNQLDALNQTVHKDLTDLQDQLDQLNQTTQDDIGAVDEKARDADAFAGMLMYLTLILFAIAIILVAVVWYVMNGKIGGGGPGSPAESMEEVDDGPSDVEREFEQLEREINAEEK
jgi:predicted  nucleic acid-binding Zn-ribbon protein